MSKEMADQILDLVAERDALKAALKRLAFAARTSGGTAGRDERLCVSCDEAEGILSELTSPVPQMGTNFVD